MTSAENPSSSPMAANLMQAAAVAPGDGLVGDIRRDKVFAALGFGEPAKKRLGRFVVLDEIGKGGMGTVLKAYDEQLDRAIAIKLLHRDVAEHASDRLRREAQALAKLSHPNVIQVHEVGEAEGQTFITMELVKGKTLREWMEEKPRDWRECVRVYLQAGRGLAAAHEAGLVHRDFKPDNAIIGKKGQIRVLDFGLARQTRGAEHIEDRPNDLDTGTLVLATSLTHTGAMIGTPGYMPAEQWQGKTADARSDQFSYCVALYEALYCERPFEGTTMHALMMSVVEGQIRLAPRGQAVPSKLRQVLLRGLAVDPERRWPSMNALLTELQRMVAPRSPRWIGLGLIAGLVATGLGVANYASVQFRCEGASKLLKEVWDDERKQKIEAAFLSTDLPYSLDAWAWVEPDLDDYADKWSAQYEEACEATSIRHEQSEEVMDMRMACLDRALLDFDAVIKALEQADIETVGRVSNLVGVLQDPSHCGSIRSISEGVKTPMSPQERRAWKAMSSAELQLKSGRAELALSILYSASLSSNGESLAHIRSMSIKGDILRSLGRFEESEAVLRQALLIASKRQQWDALRRIALQLIYVVGSQKERAREGLRYREIAEGLSVGKPLEEAEVHYTAGVVLYTSGSYKAASTEFQQGLALLEDAAESDHINISRVQKNLSLALLGHGDYARAEVECRLAIARLGNERNLDNPYMFDLWKALILVLIHRGRYQEAEVKNRWVLRRLMLTPGVDDQSFADFKILLSITLYSQGKYDEARAELEYVLSSFEQNLSMEKGRMRSHKVRMLLYRQNLALILRAQGHYEQSQSEHEQALAVAREVWGAGHPSVALLQSNLAVVFREQGKYGEAETQLRDALEVIEGALGSDSPYAGRIRSQLAVVLSREGRYVEAEAEQRHALGVLGELLELDHPHIADSQSNLATTLLKRGAVEEARHFAEQAWSLRQRADIPAEQRAETAFVLARALWPNRTQRARARGLAEQARDAFAEQGKGSEDELAEVEEWLRKHRVRSPRQTKPTQ